MNFDSPQLTIMEIKNLESSRKTLHFRFQGKFTKATSVSGSEAWTQFMNEYPTKEFEFVWDCTDMTGFEISARKEWYHAMKDYKHRIKKAHVISNQLMIRSAAKVMLQFFGIPANIYRTEEELPKAVRH